MSLDIQEKINSIKNTMPDKVTLIAVSKTRTEDEIIEAYDTGIRDFGENKVQEFIEKYDKLPKDIRWHFIGHLQRNKVKYIVGKVHLIHSLDSIRLLQEIEKQYSEKQQVAEVLIEINIGREKSKTGMLPEEVDEVVSAVEHCNSVKVKGIMVIIPKGDTDSCRLYFNKVKKIFDELRDKDFKNTEMKYLSMGMTSDYNVAIEEGSNMIRIGEGIFGKRIYNK